MHPHSKKKSSDRESDRKGCEGDVWVGLLSGRLVFLCVGVWVEEMVVSSLMMMRLVERRSWEVHGGIRTSLLLHR